MKTLGTLLFPGFELLDVTGPLEVLGNRNLDPVPFRLVSVAETAGLVASVQGPRMEAEHSFDDCPPLDAILVPGGGGTRREVDNPKLIAWLAERAAGCEMVISVCTGSGLLARAGVLDGRRATSNKRAFDWAVSQGPGVEWIRRARWVEDGRYFTSSGVSAGIDMTLHILARITTLDEARRIARVIEYRWNEDSEDDPFA